MPNSLEEFFQKLHQEVTLPVSGLTVAIRKPDNWMFLGAGELPLPTTGNPPEGSTDTTASPRLTVRDLSRYAERAIAGGVISPPMSCARDAQDDPIYSQHYIHVSELDPQDMNFLSNVLFTKLGLTPEVAQSVEAFRPDAEREDDPRVSGAIPSPTE